MIVNNGDNKRTSPGSRPGAKNIDGKRRPGVDQTSPKSTVKYTFERTQEDISNLEKLRQHLKSEFYTKNYNTDSKIYRDLPQLYLNAVKQRLDLDLAIDDLTAKLVQLQQLQDCFCRIFEICNIKNLED